MIVYFADRQLNIIGQASTELPKGLAIKGDKKTEDVETGISIFECDVPFNSENRAFVEQCTEVGNYVLRSNDSESELYTIVDVEIDTKKQQVYIYAEDDGLDLLNEVVGVYEADKAYPIDHYINKYAAGAGFEIGINEAHSLTRKLSWDGESTASARIASIATQFDGCEVSYTFQVNGLSVAKKFINIYKERGKNVGVTLRLNEDIDSIVTTKSITNLATALQCTGGTPEDDNTEDDIEPTEITLKGYAHDDGDFYVDTDGILKSRVALKRWSRLLWKTEESQKNGGHIVKQFSYDTLSQSELCSRAITELKKLREMEVNYQIDLKKIPQDVKIGDRINIVDDAGEVYVSARVLLMETSIADQECKATLGEYLIRHSGISEKVAELAAKFAENTASAARALEIAKAAKSLADDAHSQVDSAVKSVQEAQKAVDEFTDVVYEAKQSAQAAQTAANNAQSVVDEVEGKIETLETSITNAQEAAANAQVAADTAQQKAKEAVDAAQNAQDDADDAKEQAGRAEAASATANQSANSAIAESVSAKNLANAASTTAAAAKADAQKAQEDIDGLGENLETLSNTMTADYARKTDLTESTASLQSQITQNAGKIEQNVKSITVIDETANNAAELAQEAQEAAGAAQDLADQAKSDAQAAQSAADTAAAAAQAAQNEADTAKAAADTAKGVADKAEADLAAAKADLETVSSRVDATEADIAAAEKAVQDAQTAADKAKEDAADAAEKATAAQGKADTAYNNATTAQEAANEAANKAETAQATADEAKGNAAAAQSKANQAAQAAANAQETANKAVNDAAAAKEAADKADADAKQAVIDAENADKVAAQAAADLVEAKKRLAAVKANVNSTQAEVDAAQAAVDTAQAAADVAMQNATQAAAHAAQAAIDAANAQAAADKAEADAAAAQQAADEAFRLAIDAWDEVGNLSLRVISAETWMTETDELLGQYAKKTDVTQTIADSLTGYCTVEEFNSGIEETAGKITSTVTSEVSKLQIGGRNLLLYTAGGDAVKIIGGNMACASVSSWTNDSGTMTLNCSATGAAEIYYRFMNPSNSTSNLYGLEPGKNYTLSGKAKVTTTSGTMTSLDVRTQAYRLGGWSGGKRTVITTSNTADFVGFVSTFKIEEDAAGYYVSLQMYYSGSWSGTIQLKDLKLEKGDKATDWSPAIEDVAADIGDAKSIADEAKERVSSAESEIQQLADSISSLVRNGESGTLTKQDGDGLWYFDISGLEKRVSDASNGIDALDGLVRDADGKIDVLNSLASALASQVEYVRSYTDANGHPCLELGEGDSGFKLRITNTKIEFADGTTIPAYVSNKKLMIEKAEVKDELQFGEFTWKNRANGNMGLIWNGNKNLLLNTHHFTAGRPVELSSNKNDNYVDKFGEVILYTPNPLPAGSKVTIQACSDGAWAQEHNTSGTTNKNKVGMFVYWCSTLEKAKTAGGTYDAAHFCHGDGNTSGRLTWTLTVPTSQNYVRIRLNTYSDGSTVVTHKFWNIKLESGENAGVWSPSPDDIAIW